MSDLKSPEDWLFLKRIVRFGDTDSAGVIHFHNLFRWAHESWEESLQQYGLSASQVFPQSSYETEKLAIAYPIVQCKADYFAPIRTGDRLKINLIPEKIEFDSFQVQTKFKKDDKEVAKSIVRHVSIDIKTRQRCPLSDVIDLWLEASSVYFGVRPI